MHTPTQTERQALDAAINRCAGPLYHATAAIPIASGTHAQVVAMQRYHQAHMPALVGICSQIDGATPYGYTLFEPHLARQLAANLIACAEIAERHNLDVARREARRQERIALAAAISPGVVGAGAC